MKDQDQSWGEYSAGWVKYFGWAVVRWIVVIIFCYPMQHESGADGWLKEAAVVITLFFGTIFVFALRHGH